MKHSFLNFVKIGEPWTNIEVLIRQQKLSKPIVELYEHASACTMGTKLL